VNTQTHNSIAAELICSRIRFLHAGPGLKAVFMR
jgi:hypothetical protein